MESANHCSGLFASDVNEMEVSGLTAVESHLVKPPRVAESAVQVECELFDLKPVMNDSGNHSATIVFGRILKWHVNKSVLTRESVDTSKPIVDWRKLSPIARMGGDIYTAVNNGFELQRPKVKIW